MDQDTKELVGELREQTRLSGPVIGHLADLIEQYELKKDELLDAIKKWSDRTGIAVCIHCAGPVHGDTGKSGLCFPCFERASDQLARELEEAIAERPKIVSTGKTITISGVCSSPGSAYDLSNQGGA